MIKNIESMSMKGQGNNIQKCLNVVSGAEKPQKTKQNQKRQKRNTIISSSFFTQQPLQITLIE
jgi:hypothetical protein